MTSFLSNFDSVIIREMFLEGYLYIYADSGNYDHWLNYFKDDSTIQYIHTANSSPDSLVLKFFLTRKRVIEEEIQRFQEIKHLQIIKIEEQPKLVNVGVPKNTESEWEAIFKDYSFISYVYIIGFLNIIF